MAKKKGKQENKPTLGQFLSTRAAEVRDSAANAILKQDLPNVPKVPKYKGIEGFPSWLSGVLGMSDDTRINLFGYEPDPWTCLYTATSQYGDKDARATGNKTFKENPKKYGFVEIPIEETEKGDLFQFSKEGTPGHSAVFTGTDDEGGILVSYSRGGTGAQSLTEAGMRPTMAKNEPIKHVSDNEGTPTAYRYEGTPEKKIEWIHQYRDRYNTNPFEQFAPTYKHEEKPDATLVTKPFIYKAEGGFLQPKDAWDKLSMREKAEMMKVAVRNGIYNLNDIREKYNEFAEGGSKKEEEEVNTIVPFTQKTEVVITPDTEYNQYLNTLPDNQRFTPNDAYDSYLYWKLNGKPRNFREAYDKGMFTWDSSDNSYHANSIAFGDDGVGYFMKPKTHDTVGFETDWYNKGLVTEEGGTQRPMTPEEKAEWLDFRNQYNLVDDPDRPNFYRYEPKSKHSLGGPLVEAAMNEYRHGGGIHIKKENRGKFTALKKRTGHSASWFKEHGTPAQKKMAVFELNARKWKH